MEGFRALTPALLLIKFVSRVGAAFWYIWTLTSTVDWIKNLGLDTSWLVGTLTLTRVVVKLGVAFTSWKISALTLACCFIEDFACRTIV